MAEGLHRGETVPGRQKATELQSNEAAACLPSVPLYSKTPTFVDSVTHMQGGASPIHNQKYANSIQWAD